MDQYLTSPNEILGEEELYTKDDIHSYRLFITFKIAQISIGKITINWSGPKWLSSITNSLLGIKIAKKNL